MPGCCRESKEDRLNRIEASSYQSPDGIFDLAIRNQAHEKSLFDTEDTEKRLGAGLQLIRLRH